MRFARPIDDALASCSYPCTTEDLIREYGDIRIHLSEESVTLGEMLEHYPEENLESEDEARLLVYAAFGEAAIGRKGYSDRDPPQVGEPYYEPSSL